MKDVYGIADVYEGGKHGASLLNYIDNLQQEFFLGLVREDTHQGAGF
ncbi:MAG: hypothetical protein H7Y42_15660 [Chitinophagaceae bacterium]|nr:hypothetical protein [Chitinophagaceae bacterium]